MINQPTVLVLGAGASIPYGFPSGAKLVEMICGEAGQRYLNKIAPLGQKLRIISQSRIEGFQDALRRSGELSIDAFLEDRPEFIELGKKLIACALIPCEVEANLWNDISKSWYHYLFKSMSCRFEDFSKNKITFVTYNYDRSLEHFLMQRIKNKYPVTAEAAEAAFRQIKIIHLHGTLCPYDPSGVNGRLYSENDHLENVNTAAK